MAQPGVGHSIAGIVGSLVRILGTDKFSLLHILDLSQDERFGGERTAHHEG
jgi:hypothetical protein